MSYNIRYGGVGREAPLAQVIRSCEPDVVILEEASRPDVVKALSKDCGMAHCDSRFGESVAWMSREQPSAVAWHKPWVVKRAWLTLQLAGVRITGVHLAAIHSNITERRRVWEARTILSSLQRDGFHLLTGDFNSIAPGERLDLRRLPARLRTIAWATGGPIRWRTIALLLSAGYVDAQRMLHPEPAHSFPTWDPQMRLDYCFVPAQDQKRVISCDVMTPAGAREASDHFPLLTVIE